MQKGTFMRWFLTWFLVCFLAAVVLLCLSLGVRVVAATEQAPNPPAADARFAMTMALRAAGTPALLGDHASSLDLSRARSDGPTRLGV